MSGGVDSSVAAAIVKEQGYQVTGITMKIWDGPAGKGKSLHHGCYGPEEAADIEDARRVAEQLEIPFQVLDLTKEYQTEVLDYFKYEYLSGRTPNPCVRCNHKIKFKALIQKAVDSGLDFDFVASGHYARIEVDPTSQRYVIRKAADLAKDQSYFLAFLTQYQLSRLIFPLGTLNKIEVRQKAAALGLITAAKADSQNFVSGDYTDVLPRESKPGNILDLTGQIVGRHQGIQNYTIGQRKGLNISSPQGLFVTGIDPVENTLTVGSKEAIYKTECLVADLNYLAYADIQSPLELKVKIRSSQQEAPATITPQIGGKLKVIFHEPKMAITPGQAAVFYREDIVAAAGIIESVL